MRRSVFGTTPESTSPTIVSLNDQKISATHSLADLNLCATIQKKSKVYCVLFFKLTCRIIYARLYRHYRLHTRRGQERFVDVEFRHRELFAFACEAYSRVVLHGGRK